MSAEKSPQSVVKDSGEKAKAWYGLRPEESGQLDQSWLVLGWQWLQVRWDLDEMGLETASWKGDSRAKLEKLSVNADGLSQSLLTASTGRSAAERLRLSFGKPSLIGVGAQEVALDLAENEVIIKEFLSRVTGELMVCVMEIVEVVNRLYSTLAIQLSRVAEQDERVRAEASSVTNQVAQMGNHRAQLTGEISWSEGLFRQGQSTLMSRATRLKVGWKMVGGWLPDLTRAVSLLRSLTATEVRLTPLNIQQAVPVLPQIGAR